MNLRQSLPSIHKEGYIFIIIAAAFSFLIGSFISSIGWISALITIFIICFFRDPERIAPKRKNIIVSPADGLVQKIEEATAPTELKLGNKTFKRISIFLSVFNVHVNRIPATGKIKTLKYRAGKFLNASLDKASIDNERQTIVMETENGTEIIFTQIAGLIAKRIICDLDEKQEVEAGERFGIIRFGSRMDIYLPLNAEINIIEGQTAIAGETILANLATNSKQVSKPATKTTAKKATKKKTK